MGRIGFVRGTGTGAECVSKGEGRGAFGGVGEGAGGERDMR